MSMMKASFSQDKVLPVEIRLIVFEKFPRSLFGEYEYLFVHKTMTTKPTTFVSSYFRDIQ